MKRRHFLRALALPLAAEFAAPALAQQPGKVPVVGILFLSAGPEDPIVQLLRQGLQEYGYVEGRNVRIEHRYAQGKQERLPGLARELIDSGAEAVIVGGDPLARAIAGASSTVPIVLVAYDYDPVAAGLVASLSHPGGQVTGIFTRTSELIGKHLELVTDALPGISRVAVFHDDWGRRQLKAVESAARALRLRLTVIDLTGRYDYRAAFRAARQAKAGAVFFVTSPRFYVDRAGMSKLAIDSRMPTCVQEEAFARAGALISYGPAFREVWPRAGYFVDRILRGAKPGDIPMEQASKFRLVVNLKTADALRIKIPPAIILRADEVIQ